MGIVAALIEPLYGHLVIVTLKDCWCQAIQTLRPSLDALCN
jgi:hypothetical protein